MFNIYLLIFWGGFPYPIFFCANLLVRVKLGYSPEFQLPRSFVSALKVRGRKERKKMEGRIMPSLVATTSALAHTMCVRTFYVRTKIMLWHSRQCSHICELGIPAKVSIPVRAIRYWSPTPLYIFRFFAAVVCLILIVVFVFF